MDSARLTSAKQKLGITYELKPEQISALRAFTESKDLVCLLPTGFGKSVIFQLMPFITEDPMAVVLVISPLNAIMKDQVRKLCESGIPACFLDITGRDGSTYILKPALGTDIEDESEEREDSSIDDETDEDVGKLLMKVSPEEVAAGKFRLIYAHPEAFLSSREGRKILQSQALQDHVCGFEDFRKDFARIQELLGIFPRVPVSLFTATASQSTKEKLVKNLGLRNPTFISKNPDRPNIKYYKYQRLPSMRQEDDLDKILGDIVTGLQKDRRHYPLTFIYTDLESIRYGYRFLENKLGIESPENRYYAQYHTHYPEKMKNFIIGELGKSDPIIRVVLATTVNFNIVS
ncbi:uncharacterized protein LOC134235606 [Saccostrea cucullata]|uniref:uncharacterized protein LOC134235606 n=1 Tax=Saccostrea cuccullata TaxID=36930 RepID=UPI002ED34452